MSEINTRLSVTRFSYNTQLNFLIKDTLKTICLVLGKAMAHQLNMPSRLYNLLIQQKFPNCLCSISTRQLELLLWRAGHTAQHMQDSPIFFLQLNYCA